MKLPAAVDGRRRRFLVDVNKARLLRLCVLCRRELGPIAATKEDRLHQGH